MTTLNFWHRLPGKHVICLMLLVIICWSANVCGRRPRGPKWWELGHTEDPSVLISHEVMSNTLRDHHLPLQVQKLLRKKQRKLLRHREDVLVAIANGAKMALENCQHHFRDRRWNCSFSRRKRKALFGKIVSLPCRETAFIYALTSAAVLHSVTRSCTEGSIKSCSCNYVPSTPSGVPYDQQFTYTNHLIPTSENSIDTGQSYHWGGCSDNIEYGLKFAKAFVDAGEKGRDLVSVMNLHNNKAGRLHVATSMRQDCKCHGMSGSCAVKTCWKRLPHFEKVGFRLKERFDSASHVCANNDYLPRPNDPKKTLLKKHGHKDKRAIVIRPINPKYKFPSKMDLIYLEASPDFCSRSKELGIVGTKGRECNVTSRGLDGCDLMCCGRGHRTQVKEVWERCKCNFQWCCDVKCQRCYSLRTVHTCL